MKFHIWGIILYLLCCVGCRENTRPDVSSLLREIKIKRLDLAVFRLDTLNPDIHALHREYGRYFDVYTNGVLQLGYWSDSDFADLFALFLQDPVMREVADSVAGKYPDMDKQEKQLASAWAYYAYYFPKRSIPEVYTHISGFNQSIIVDSMAVGISLDNYLGEKCAFYSMLAVPVPVYARKRMTGNDIVRDAVVGWLYTEFPFHPRKNDLISGMIYQGKIMYLVEKLFPEEAPYWWLGFSQEQWDWCEENEDRIWGFLVENEYLFSTQQRLIMKYLNDAPFTSGMPAESPGRAVVWTGLKIVEKYMEKTSTAPEGLMEEQDYHKMLRVAGYRP